MCAPFARRFRAQKNLQRKSFGSGETIEDAGLRRLHIVDLDGAKNGKVTNLSVLEMIAGNTNLTIDFGGGIKSDEDIESVFEAGVAMASIGSVAVKDVEKFFPGSKNTAANAFYLEQT
jgi:phosphoribosylformimino-5-aminoimidazole carboxamide ribotide isomerase